MKMEKIFGWLLLFLGVAIILYTLFTSLNIFTGAVPPPDIFELEQEKASLDIVQKESKTLNAQSQSDIQSQIGEMIGEQFGEQLKDILPSNLLPVLLNLMIWSMCAGILIFGGVQIGNLGVKLIKQ